MGYSARYHAASLAAVFLALAIGILIGVGFADDLVQGTAEDLEASLEGDLDDARGQIDDLGDELAIERSFTDEVYPALVADRLEGVSVGVLALGGLSQSLRDDITAALEPSGAEIAKVAVVAEPPDRVPLAEATEDRVRDLRRNDRALEGYGTAAGRSFVDGGGAFEATREVLLSRFSGSEGAVDAVIVVRDTPSGLDDDEDSTTDLVEDGLVDGVDEADVNAIGVERSDARDSSVAYFGGRGLTTVDDIDLAPGRVALVYALAGAEGDFGVKSTAEALLPDLLTTPSGAPTPAP